MSVSVPAWLRAALLAGGTAVLLAGVLLRVHGLGAAPLEIDEYYFTRSIDNILRSGWPAFECGGYYTRGLLLQYLSAGGRLAGLSPELAPRVLAAGAGLLMLPAAYGLGRRLHGPVAAWLTIVILALSVWDIELARFGRMYAPFQCLSTWYLYFFLRHTVDGDRRALWFMLTLSIISPFIWEGGVLLLLANLLPPLLRSEWPPPRTAWWYWLGTLPLLALGYWFVSADFRGFNASSWPSGYDQSLALTPADTLASVSLPLSALAGRTGWLLLGLMPLLAAAAAARWVFRQRLQLPATVGLCVMLAAALAHQFLVVAAVVLLLALLNWVRPAQLSPRAALPLYTALALALLFWMAYGIASIDWRAGPVPAPRLAASLLYEMMRLPDVIGVVVRPWGRSVPWLGAGLLLCLAVATFRRLRSAGRAVDNEAALLIALLVLLLAAGVSSPPRLETRYVAFLYPALVAMAVAVIARSMERIAARPATAMALTGTVALGGFALSEDFQPRHLLHLNEPQETFRLTMSPDMMSHLIIRDDYRAIAAWLRQQVGPGDLVINGVHALDYYYPRIDYFYVDLRDSNFAQWSCRGGTVERWGNYPLLSTTQALSQRIDSGATTYLVVFRPDAQPMMARLAFLHPSLAWEQGYVAVVRLKGSP